MWNNKLYERRDIEDLIYKLSNHQKAIGIFKFKGGVKLCKKGTQQFKQLMDECGWRLRGVYKTGIEADYLRNELKEIFQEVDQ